MSKLRGPTAVFALGVATEYFLDPRHGRRRRHVLRDRTLHMLRRAERLTSREARHGAGRARGLAAEARTAVTPRDKPADDVTLRQRILSDAFRHANVPTSDVEVEVAEGRVTLRGHVASTVLADDLVAHVRGIPGVRDVEAALAVSDPA
jgi:osmotically-inducible protein OsmY